MCTAPHLDKLLETPDVHVRFLEQALYRLWGKSLYTFSTQEL